MKNFQDFIGLIGFDNNGSTIVFFDGNKKEIHRSVVISYPIQPDSNGQFRIRFIYDASKFFSNIVNLQLTIEDDSSGEHLFLFKFEAAPVFSPFSIDALSGGAGAGGGQCCQN